MKFKLIFHLGLPKTGSSAIQGFLSHNKLILSEKYGVLYPNLTSRNFLNATPHNHVKYFLAIESENKIQKCIDDFMACKDFCAKKNISTVVISNENFTSEWYIGLLQKIIEKTGAECKFVIYLRRQDHFLESAWKQWGHKDPAYRDIHEYIQVRRADWKYILTPWLSVFDPDHFIVRTFEREEIGEDVVTDFLRILGISTKEDFSSPKPSNLNVNAGFSPEIIQIMTVCKLVASGNDDRRLMDLFSNALPARYKKTDPFKCYGLLSPRERYEILLQYEKSNQELSKILFGPSRESLFLEPWPDPDESWGNKNDLTLEKVLPVLMEIILFQQHQLTLLQSNKKDSNIIRKWFRVFFRHKYLSDIHF